MRRLREAWDRFFFTEAPVLGVVLFRVGLAVWTMGLFALRLPYLAEVHSGHPLGQPIPQLAAIAPYVPLWAIWALYGVAFVVLFLFALGWNARIMHSLFLLLSFVLIGWDTALLRAYGRLGWTQWLLLYAAPYDLPRHAQAPVWGVRLLQLQFSSVYVFTVLAKTFEGFGWFDGATLYWSLHNPQWVRDWVSALPLTRDVTRPLGWAVLATELFIAFGLYFERTRRLAILACLGMHLGIQAMLRIPLLFPTVMWIHLVLFVKWTPGPGGEQRTQDADPSARR
jgi:hypothetical protein